MRQLIGSCTKQVPDIELRRIGVPTTLLWEAPTGQALVARLKASLAAAASVASRSAPH